MIDEDKVAKFKAKGASFNYDVIKSLVEAEEWGPDFFGGEKDTESRQIFLGSIYSLYPSGKFYTPWAHSNVSEEEAIADEKWREEVDNRLSDIGLCLIFDNDDAFAVEFREAGQPAE